MNIIIAVISQIIIWTTIIAILLLNGIYKFQDPQYFTDYNSIFVIIESISIFLIFKNINIKSSIINWIAASVFSVYLIHENIYLFPIIWKDLFYATYFYNNINVLYIIIMLVSLIIVFIISILIDKIYLTFVQKNISKLLDKKNKIIIIINQAFNDNQ